MEEVSKIEEKILKFWQENNIFEKSVDKKSSKGNYIFYDGPPFITGLPHYATLLPSIAKDVIPRYQTMKGHRVSRVWGWDCHGLPAENKVEEQLGLKNKKDIENLGVDNFIKACRDYVRAGSEQWRWYIDRIGRWVDMDNAYKTMDLNFMESVIWAFKKLYDADLIYEGYRTSLHCPRCATPLSRFEITMDAGSYKDIEDDAIVVEFKTENDLYLLAWTTTPWTLPGNLALAVGEKIDYVILESLDKKYVLAKEKVEDFFKEKEFKIIKEIKGKELIGFEYEPISDLKINSKNAFKVYHGDFVSLEEGTGIVHVAPNFGEDDFELGKKVDLPIIELMDENGVYTDEAGKWSGYYFKKANKKALESLTSRIFSQSKHVHSYPFCYRCRTELIHKTQKAWYLKIDKIRDKMIERNAKINWVPDYFKEGRFQYNLENAPDWCLSRSRYWGSPVPVWKCGICFSQRVVGSIEEIEKLSNQKITDLHRPNIDEIEFDCSCGGKMKRVLEVLDCWFESGSMPFAQFHYPFEKNKDWSNLFPADFIIEYTGQLRGWFYYLHVLANALFDDVAFKNVIVTGVLAGTDGRKMSKSFGNYPDPKEVLNKYGSDALRIYFMSSPIMLGGDMNLSEEDIRDSLRKNVMLLLNVLNFYTLFSKDYNLSDKEPKVENILDKWIIAKINELIKEVDSNLENYNLPAACGFISSFIGDLSTWYIRRSRNRFKNNEKKALETTGYVLLQLSKVIAPIMPFLAEEVWQTITGNGLKNKDKSVHLENWPQLGSIDLKVLSEMEQARKVVELGLACRNEKKIKVRQPLSCLIIQNCKLKEDYFDLVKEELNVKDIKEKDSGEEILVELDLNITEELKLEGLKREIIRFINEFRKEKGLSINDIINLYYQTQSHEIKKVLHDFKSEILENTIAQEITEKEPGNLDSKSGEINGHEVVFGIDYV